MLWGGGGGGYYTVGNNAMYNTMGLRDCMVTVILRKKFFLHYSLKACFPSIFQYILPFRNPWCIC